MSSLTYSFLTGVTAVCSLRDADILCQTSSAKESTFPPNLCVIKKRSGCWHSGSEREVEYKDDLFTKTDPKFGGHPHICKLEALMKNKHMMLQRPHVRGEGFEDTTLWMCRV